MPEKYHINRNGEVRECKAKSPESCRAKPPDGIDQVHGEDARGVDDVLARQYNDLWSGIRRKKFPPIPEKITPELLGDPSTDVERLSVQSKKKWNSGVTSHHIWLHDTEERPIGFINVNEYEGRLGLCDIEVRPEYRGNKLSTRLMDAVEKKFGQKLTHEGGYTPDGYERVAKRFHDEESMARTKAEFNPQTFVANWDKEWSKYPI